MDAQRQQEEVVNYHDKVTRAKDAISPKEIRKNPTRFFRLDLITTHLSMIDYQSFDKTKCQEYHKILKSNFYSRSDCLTKEQVIPEGWFS